MTAAVAFLCSLPGLTFAAKAERADRIEPVHVTGVRYWSTGNVTRVAVEVSGPFRYTADRIANPERLFFDLRGAKPDMVHKGIHLIPVADSQLGQIRVAETQPNVTRIVLDLLRPVVITTSQLSSPNRLVVELRAKDVDSEPVRERITTGSNREPAVQPNAEPIVQTVIQPATPSTIPPSSSTLEAVLDVSRPRKPEPRRFELPPPHVAARVPEPSMPAPPQLVAALAKPMRIPVFPPQVPRDLPPPFVNETPSVALGQSVDHGIDPAAGHIDEHTPSVSSSVGRSPLPASGQDSSLTRLLGLKLGRIVLDAGHGGQDQGTHGRSGYLEKDLVLDVTQRLGEMLTERLGAEVVYTRSDDNFVALEERTRIANQRKADLFLSIHANSSPYRVAAGIETYVLNFTPSRGANEVAARENAASSSNMHELRSLVEKIAQNDKASESRAFATRLQSSLAALSVKSVDEARNRGIKTAPFVVLIGATMPSVLVEIGFLSNPDEETLLRKPEYRQKIAESLFKGILAYSETLSRFDVARKD